MTTMTQRPLVLIILDGFGCRGEPTDNAIASAQTPVWDKLWSEYPHTTLAASGLEVGLPKNQMGNSEVGHLTMGAGRVVFQDLTRISNAIEQGTFYQNPVLIDALKHAVKERQSLHILGLLSPGGVHSHEDHIQTLIQLGVATGVENIFIHAFLDGRDTPPKSAMQSLLALQKQCESLNSVNGSLKAHIASISGRYFAMDRDKRWERTQAVYTLLTEGKARYCAFSPVEGLSAAYARGETDEFVQPTLILPTCSIQENDLVVFTNFRADRARQLSYALRDPNFVGFERSVFFNRLNFVTFTHYADNIPAKVAFPTQGLNNLLSTYLERHHLRQLRIAESEKYAHVTFFFNGGNEMPCEGEDRIFIPSKKISSYDLSPEMSALEITAKLTEAIRSSKYDVIICNYANADMVGHTGNFKATVQAIETLDRCLGKVLDTLKVSGGEAIITADHGNAERMFDATTQQPHTAHTSEPVPFVYVGRSAQIAKPQGALSDIAPTLISLLGLPVPVEMTGHSLLKLER